MSTKSLKRSVYEQGRGKRQSKDRKFSNKELRSRERAYLSDIKKNPDACDDLPDPVRDDQWGWHGSKLTPVYRWLHSQVGRQWNEIYSELVQKIPIHAEAFRWLRHSIHQFGSSDYKTPFYFHRNQFLVDENGIFNKAEKITRPKRQPSKYTTAEIADWLNGRIVGKVGRKLYWFHINASSSWAEEWKTAWNSNWFHPKYSGYSYYSAYSSLNYVQKCYTPIYKDGVIIDQKEEWMAATYKITARQYKELSKTDLEFWNQIPNYHQDKILEWSPTSDANPMKSKYW